MSPWEWLGWIIFVILVSLLFFAAFGNSKYTEASIDEYMENLINDERGRTGPN
jgi:hypothetical protein|tara:strand:+ start:709 stop:867 length:159 start_codon:yes stop_codon:yes gene_type:complete